MSIRQKTVLEIRRQLGTGTVAAGTVMGGTVLVGGSPYSLTGPGITGDLPVARLSTTEMDTTKVAAPDGTGGVIFRAESHTHVWAETPGGTVDGVNDTFTLAAAPTPPESLTLFRQGLLQTAVD